MNEMGFERWLSDWLREDQPSASTWVLGSVIEHAHRRSNRSWWRRLPLVAPWLIEGHSEPPGMNQPANRRFVSLAAVMAIATVLLMTLPMLSLPAAPGSDEDHVIVPAVSLPVASPAASAACSPAASLAPSAADTLAPSQLAPEATPAAAWPDVPVAEGLTGSVWLEQTEGAPDHYLALHPDGTVVEGIGPQTTVGIGVWQPTGEHSLSSVIVYTDADPVGHASPGQSTYRADWVLDDSNENGTLTWSATLQAAEEAALVEVTGEATITRLHLAALPATARYPVPDEQPWTLELGAMALGPGSGQVNAVGDVAALSSCTTSHDDPPGYVIWHGDGTTFIASTGGVGAGLWEPTGPDTSAMTTWSILSAANERGAWVAEKRGRLVLTGNESEFEGSFVAALRRLKPMDGREHPPLDAAQWPASGSVWLQPTEGAMAVVAYLADGTVVARHPAYGTGAGYWQPTDADSIAASVFFATTPHQDHSLLWEATISQDEQRQSIEYQLVDTNSGAIDAGTAEAERLRLEP
jgi:hypothetical protein